MSETRRLKSVAGTLVLSLAGSLALAAQGTPTADHGIVGSWFGMAIEVCPSGVPISACTGGLPAIVLYMSPTLTSDGNFVADDSLTLGTPPFGPHGAAHGQWIATSSTEFVVDYTFMLNTYPPPSAANASVIAGRFRWAGHVVDENTAVGYVNMYLPPPLPLVWTALEPGEFPTLPDEVTPVVTSPDGFVTDPNTCRTPGCPLVFKFTIKRVAP